MAKSKKIVAAVDVGTTKIVVVAGQWTEEGKVEILGIGTSASAGVRRGVVLNIEEVSRAIDVALRQAEEHIGTDIDEVYVNIVGQQLKTFSLKAEKYIDKDHLVTEADVEFLIQKVKKAELPEGYKIYHAEPQLYQVDQEGECPDPVGMKAEHLEVEFKLLVAPESYESNLQLGLEQTGIKVKQAIIDPLASSEILLTEEEKETGVILLDIGGGTTKLAIFHEGVLRYSSLIPFGGNVLTHDIKEGCSIVLRQAESLKTQFGQAMGDFAPEDKVVTIPSPSGWEPKEISFRNLAYVIQARMEEIIESINFHIEKSGFGDRIGAGIVLTGGTALLLNLNQLLKYQTGMDVRIGVPRLKTDKPWKGLEDPRFATVLGLLQIGLKETAFDGKKEPVKKKVAKPKSNSFGFLKSMKEGVARQMDMFFNDEQGIEMK
ncbi:cell division protein FtsA [Mangrovibacterium diazotrophicum]|uniref:Cell division protein FtsA n=1 Tax=Mangrovibacterium diazotrophicum TaxID=1261403 RepID=A0A419VV99_9BACT|nr:cell division protein FtsA [Mangrovibacterium diazotrophicum]RKD86080.1 cell division protein FtsA [Mangrovibacterium diazotrophicum]